MVESFMHSIEPQKKIKVVILGDAKVGKTWLINRFVYDSVMEFESRLGISFLSKTFELNGRIVRFTLWETPSHERFDAVIPSFISDYSAALIVFDIVNKQSFLNCEKWAEYFRNERKNNTVIVLVGNKSDKGEQRTVTKQEAQIQAKNFEAFYMEISACTGENINQLFTQIAVFLLDKPNNGLFSHFLQQ